MPYPSISFRYSRVLSETLISRASILGYETVGAYVRGVIREDLLRELPHAFGVVVESSSPERRDRIDEKLASPKGREELRKWDF